LLDYTQLSIMRSLTSTWVIEKFNLRVEKFS
jgi:hypothetical protein